MVRRFINASTIQIKKIPSAAPHGGKEQIPLWPTALAQRHAAAWR
jgi:hypothetical protein